MVREGHTARLAAAGLFLVSWPVLLLSQGAPDLSGLPANHRDAILYSCRFQQRGNPAAYWACLNREFTAYQRAAPAPDLSGLPANHREGILYSCRFQQRGNPAAYWACLNREFAAYQRSVLHAIQVAHDGLVYVADREYRRVQVFTQEGTFVTQLVRTDASFARNLVLSADSEQQFLYVGGGDGIVVVDRKTLEILGMVQPQGILGAGHQIATDSKGNLYIAATGAGMQKLTFKGMSQ